MAYRRRVGVGRAGPKFTKKAEEMKAVSLSSAMETVEKLEVKLAEFAKKHKKEIQHDPAFRKKFLEMCAPLGVDPLSSEKGFWGSMLGIGEFYYELAVKVAEVCMASKSRNGGIISVAEVRSILMKRGTKFQFAESANKSSYSKEDIITAVGKLAKLGGGFRTMEVGKSTMIISVPTELDSDHMEVMKIAQDAAGVISSGPSGRVTVNDVKAVTHWNEERIKRALELLLGKGMAWLDLQGEEESFWFPSVWKEGTGAILTESDDS
uniref:Vacuolar-sorting protein SNF8 n=1 Tax=Trieres chinensis TaxID=1514140 RepID=A0A7S2EAJ9_TRICV|mmetsp:Transcript_14602/g.29985  ORF Transcript_14602/g.29985 Transcript_14602/m.29985 type:complete len:265 (+) Transcript_14602:99-893(+)|eukprot:CAMPEP_0183312892 /NCGR_PEP_ID=MMETSP0160_2-20130417/43421_1 /TAXON_ID=2839 ORGANISM="Odontella Sinensis, Strain Grunow 1884" /NCGR_SAMPLE_ID=MMETSP0160_2 /ASSEMBLY_ACC=CAM_ASM_000250 /LENGTH=264 /DNA_ID=CAMNT_0025477841 /DNA_START=96 /DNA_END=890 /DNA_ORIENTATION=-